MTEISINLSYLFVVGLGLLLVISIITAIGLLIYGLFIKRKN